MECKTKSTPLITHGHADHARPGHSHVLATQQTLDIMAIRYGPKHIGSRQAASYGQALDVNGVDVVFWPAGHVLGSAQIQLTYNKQRVILSGDYKRAADPSCPAFEVHPCDVFITEATFGLPVFQHPDPVQECAKALKALEEFPDSSVIIGVYALGKAQRVMLLLRQAGYTAPFYMHGALEKLTHYYQSQGCTFGALEKATVAHKQDMRGKIILAPPSAMVDRWARRFESPVIAMASGWMQVRQRAKQRGVELPLIISDHADWPDLCRTIEEVDAPEIWITHGREDALAHHIQKTGRTARALRLIGREEEAV